MPIEKELMPGFIAKVNEAGNLTLTRVATITLFRWTMKIPTTITLPAQAVRALHNLLRKDAVRKLTGYRNVN